MYKRILLLLITVSLQPHLLSAQATKKKFLFQSFNQFGVVKGASEASFTIQSVNGVQHKSWFVGAGLGLDEYYYSSLPLFLDIKKTLPQKWKSVFLYGDGGWNFALEKNHDSPFGSDKNKGGWYYDVGFGYSKPIKKLHFVASAGYTQKILKRTETYYSYFFNEEKPQFIFNHTYRLSRLSLKVGLAF